MAGFRRAFALGCPMVECDIRRSRDGALVLAHDSHVTDKAGIRYDIDQADDATLASLDLGAGEGVPSLRDLVNWAAESGAAIMADMKTSGNGVEVEVARQLAPLPPAQKIVPGAGEEARRLFRAADPELPLSLSLGKNDLNDERYARVLSEYEALCFGAVTWEWPLLTQERIAELHAAGLRVFAWTVDDPDVMQRLADWGVDGIISNRAEIVANLAAGKPISVSG